MRFVRSALCALLVFAVAGADESAGPVYVPYNPSGIYALGERVGWHVTLPWSAQEATYVIRKNNLAEIGRGIVRPGTPTNIETTLDEPGMVYVEVTETAPGAKPKALGAAVAPEKIGAAIPAPKDFDAFWTAKIKALRKVPAKPVFTEKPSEKDGVDFGILRMDHLDGKHVWAQVAKPHDATGKKKYPGLVILQWASPPYPLQKSWVTDRAAEGWLAVNVEPHDVMPDQPKEYYDALPAELKNYNGIETRNRDRNYFLYMYLGDIRAVDYLASRPDWDGKTLVVMGTSMGGQQSLCTAGLHPKVTAMLINVPAGADANGNAHGRKIGYPFWDVNDPKVLETAQYFDTLNCAAHIKVPSLVSMGFIDTVTPPVGIWAAFNQIQGRKEAAPMPDSPHNHLATPEQSKPWNDASARWLGALVAGNSPFERADGPTPRSDAQYADLLANWKQNFTGWNAANFGWGADQTQHMAEVVRGVTAVVGEIRQCAPDATVIVTGITPRNDDIAVMPIINDANRGIAALADGKSIRYINVNEGLADAENILRPGMAHDGLHLAPLGYQVWADALKPIFTEILGEPSKTDTAPAPTGDPSAKP